jgi:hypothetical protein
MPRNMIPVRLPSPASQTSTAPQARHKLAHRGSGGKNCKKKLERRRCDISVSVAAPIPQALSSSCGRLPLTCLHRCLYLCSSAFICGDFDLRVPSQGRPYSFCLSFRICSNICSAQAGGSGPLLKSNFIPSANFHRSIHNIPVPT